MVGLSVTRKPDAEDAQLKFFHKTRFIILIICTLCLSIAQSDTLTLNFTIICMADGAANASETFTNATDSPYLYTAGQKNLLFSMVAIGAMVAVYPIMFIIQIFGTRKIVFLMGLVSAVSTCLVPWMASLGFYPLLVMRFIQGTGLSTAFTLIGIVTRQWSMQVQSAFYIAVLTCFFQIGPIFTMPIAGAFCTSSLGWQAVYYLHAIVTLVLFLIFYYFYREQPTRHSCVSVKEIEKIQRGKGENKKQPVPILAIVRDPVIIAIWISALGNFMGIQLTMQFSPTYLNKVMGFPVEQTGTFSAIPQVVTFILKIIAGYSADKMRCCTPQTSTKIFNTLALGGMSLAFLGLALIPTTMPLFGLIMLIIACSIIGFNCGAFFRASAIYAAQHNHFIMGVNSFLNCLSCLLAPVIVNIFVSNDEWDEWWWVWMVHFIFLFSCNIIFLILGKGVPAEWTKPGYGKKVADVESPPPIVAQNGTA